MYIVFLGGVGGSNSNTVIRTIKSEKQYLLTTQNATSIINIFSRWIYRIQQLRDKLLHVNHLNLFNSNKYRDYSDLLSCSKIDKMHLVAQGD